MGKPKPPEQHGSIEIDQDLDHARALWRVQTIGWVVIALILVAAIAGIFGDGPLAHASASSDGLTIRYDRFARHGAPTRIEVDVPASMRRGDTLRLWFDREFLEGVRIESVKPEPTSVAAQADSLWFTLMAPQSPSPALVTLVLRPDEFWSRRGRIGVEGRTTVVFHQFVFP